MALQTNRLKDGRLSYTIKIRRKKVAYYEHLGPIPRKDAEQANRAAKVDSARGLWPKPKPALPTPTIPTLAAFVRDTFLPWYAEDRRASSLKRVADRCRLHLIPEAGQYRLDELTTLRINRYRSIRLAQGAARHTINNELTTLGQILHAARDWGLVPPGMPPKITQLRVEERAQRVLSPDEVSALLMAANAHLRPVIGFALMTGLRLKELLTLTWRDLRLTGPNPDVTVTGAHSKSHKARQVPLNTVAISIVEGLPRPHHPQARVFGYLCLDHAVPLASRRAGLEGVSAHTLRRTFATVALALTGNVRLVQKWLGHASLVTTANYLHPLPAYEREAIELVANPESVHKRVHNLSTSLDYNG